MASNTLAEELRINCTEDPRELSWKIDGQHIRVTALSGRITVVGQELGPLLVDQRYQISILEGLGTTWSVGQIADEHNLTYPPGSALVIRYSSELDTYEKILTDRIHWFVAPARAASPPWHLEGASEDAVRTWLCDGALLEHELQIPLLDPARAFEVVDRAALGACILDALEQAASSLSAQRLLECAGLLGFAMNADTEVGDNMNETEATEVVLRAAVAATFAGEQAIVILQISWTEIDCSIHDMLRAGPSEGDSLLVRGWLNLLARHDTFQEYLLTRLPGVPTKTWLIEMPGNDRLW